jgi:hypothetical protein
LGGGWGFGAFNNFLYLCNMRKIPFFLRGAGSVLNIAGNYFPSSGIGAKADIKAIRADWVAIGNDINAAMAKVRRY